MSRRFSNPAHSSLLLELPAQGGACRFDQRTATHQFDYKTKESLAALLEVFELRGIKWGPARPVENTPAQKHSLGGRSEIPTLFGRDLRGMVKRLWAAGPGSI